MPYILEHCDTFHTFLLSKFICFTWCSKSEVLCLSHAVLNLASDWVVAKFCLLFSGMAQQIVTLHEKNGGISKNVNVISNQDAD